MPSSQVREGDAPLCDWDGCNNIAITRLHDAPGYDGMALCADCLEEWCQDPDLGLLEDDDAE